MLSKIRAILIISLVYHYFDEYYIEPVSHSTNYWLGLLTIVVRKLDTAQLSRKIYFLFYVIKFL